MSAARERTETKLSVTVCEKHEKRTFGSSMIGFFFVLPFEPFFFALPFAPGLPLAAVADFVALALGGIERLM